MVANMLVGLLLAFLGLLVCFAGLRVFFITLPIVGFISGFYLGAAGIAAAFGEGFLSSLTAIFAGIVLGLIFAVLSYLFWYIGALLAAGSVGAFIGSGLMNALGIETDWIVFLAATTGGIILFALALILALPVYVVIVNTALFGAAGVIAGVLLLFNQIDRVHLGYGLVWAMIEASLFWLIVWIALSAVGMVLQLRTVAAVRLPEDRWVPARAVPAE